MVITGFDLTATAEAWYPQQYRRHVLCMVTQSLARRERKARPKGPCSGQKRRRWAEIERHVGR